MPRIIARMDSSCALAATLVPCFSLPAETLANMFPGLFRFFLCRPAVHSDTPTSYWSNCLGSKPSISESQKQANPHGIHGFVMEVTLLGLATDPEDINSCSRGRSPDGVILLKVKNLDHSIIALHYLRINCIRAVPQQTKPSITPCAKPWPLAWPVGPQASPPPLTRVQLVFFQALLNPFQYLTPYLGRV